MKGEASTFVHPRINATIMKTRYVGLLLLTLNLSNCKTESTTENQGEIQSETSLIQDGRSAMEIAHHKTQFSEKEALKFDFKLHFGGNLKADATQFLSTNSDYIKLNFKDGRTLLFDGNQVLMSPDTVQVTNERFDIFTWSYFFALPYKITDPGTHWENLNNKTINGIEYEVDRLTFSENVGDAPDDWYIIYADKTTHQIKAAAYIVTFKNDTETAEKNPHAIVFHDYQLVENVPFATRWTFHNWNENEGWTDTLGSATLSDFQFLKRSEMEVKTESGFQLVPR
jgi:hypothetical protein